MVYPDNWTCPICKTYVKNSERCTNCTYPGLWHCPKCGFNNNSSITCTECGLNPLNPSKSKRIIKRNQVLTIIVIVYTLLLSFLLFRILTQDNITIIGDTLINNDLSLLFYTFQRLDSVVITFESPTGNIYSYPAVQNTVNTWLVANITLEESGDWSLRIEKVRNNRATFYSKIVMISSECTTNAHCFFKGKDYECNTKLGLCVQHEPGIFDFLEVVGVSI